jgi:hypothetical protein
MRDCVLEFGRFKASAIAGLVFFALAVISTGVIILLFFGGEAIPLDFGLIPLLAALLSLPLGSFLGHQLLHKEVGSNDKKSSVKKIAMVGLLVPGISSCLPLFVLTGGSPLLSLVANPSVDHFLDLMIATTFLTLISQMFVGWLIYPCGLFAAYVLSKLAASKTLDSPTTISLFKLGQKPLK